MAMYLSDEAGHVSHHRPRYHPTAKYLIESHDQSNWSVTADGLICAPVGYYRILELYGDDGPTLALAFAFNASDLDLVPYADDPTRKTLKKTSYILEPIEDTYVKDRVEMSMRDHQGDWLAFVLSFGNLYHSDRSADDGGQYYSNNFISYAIFPQLNEDGTTHYALRFRTDPYSKSFGIGLHQNDDSILEHGIDLGIFASEEEAIQEILKDFREVRYPAFLKGLEIQRWDDGDYRRNVAMWFSNQVNHFLNEPFLTGAALSKIIELMLTKYSGPAMVIEAGIRALDHDAEGEEHPGRLRDVAEVVEDNGVPLHVMKEDVPQKWVVAENVKRYLSRDFVACLDMDTHKRSRAIDVINGIDPVLVMTSPHEKGPIISARTHHGLNIHSLDKGAVRFVTYTAANDQRSDAATLPPLLRPLFSDGGIACIQRCPKHKPLPDAFKIFHRIPHDPRHHWIYGFVPPQTVLQHAANDKYMSSSIERHRVPAFDQAEMAFGTSDVQEKMSFFRQCSRALTHYAKMAWPFKDANNQSACYLSYITFAVGALAHGDVLGRVVENGAPWLFALSAGLMTKRLAANALTKLGKANLNVVANGFYTLGPALYLAQEIYTKFVEHDYGEMSENVLSMTFSAGMGLGFGLKTYAMARRAISLHKETHQQKPQL